MRLGIITGEYPPMQGGVGAYTRILAHQYADLGHSVFVYADHRAVEPREDIHLTAKTKQWGYGTLRQIQRWARDNALDVINLQFETAAYGMSAWVHFLPDWVKNVPIVTTFHDLLTPYLFPKAGNLRKWIVNHLASKSAGVIATNHEDYYRLQDLTNAELIPIGSNIPNRLPADYDRVQWRCKANATEDDFLVAYFGFMNRTKGVDILLEDAAKLIGTGYPIKLVMIGGLTGTSDPANQAYADEIHQLIDELGIAKFITWTGYIDDESVSAFLTCCDCVCLPFMDGASYRRGSLMAAIQHGCAIITTKPQVNIPLFVDGKNMLMARYELISDSTPPFLHVSPGILQLYRDEDLCQRLKAGANDLAKQFQWESIAAENVRFFQQVIHATKASPR
jgi:glycosyltransferase involved in cell wall biosynthesis